MSGEKKWINLSFIAAALILSWVLNQALILVARYARFKNPMVMGVLPSTAVFSLVVCVLFVFFYARQPHVQHFSYAVVDEMKKVVWPEKKSAYASTLVVVLTVAFMAAVLGVFDWLCGSVIGLVLKS